MKRKLIEEIGCHDNINLFTNKVPLHSDSESNYSRYEKMYTKSNWYSALQNSKKTCLKHEKMKKIHYKFADGKEMVEEYNTDTCVMLRRAWKVQKDLGGEDAWEVEVGDPLPQMNNLEAAGIVERNDQPTVTKRNTRINLEWRIRNLPFPIETYSINVHEEEKCIVVRTSNKKYFKKLPILELARLNIPLNQMNLQCSHKFNTLFIQYKKPLELIEFEKAWWQVVEKISPRDHCGDTREVPDECKTN